ncbi:unnamed protein product [Trichobilharzia szidati]|nr:unnamed protein product [Trichobilharzia szidati]
MNTRTDRQDQLPNDSPPNISVVNSSMATENNSLSPREMQATFPVHALTTLNSLLSRPQWQVPVLPESQLEIVLIASINMAKNGEDIFSKECLRFYSDGLIISFTKIFQDDAVSRWDSHVLHFIYANALLAIELCSFKAKSDCTPILELESILFDPHSRFHKRSIDSTNVSQEIRYGIHKNAVCRFDNIIKLLPHLSVNKLNMQEYQEEVNYEEMNENSSHLNSSTSLNLREYSIPYVNYEDAPVLLDFINLFGRLSGFDRLKSRLMALENNDEKPQQQQQNVEEDKKEQEQQSTDRTEHLSLSLIYAYLQPFALCCYFLNDTVMEEYFQPIVNTVLNYLSRISDDQIKRESKKEAKYDFIAGLKFILCALLKRMPSSKEEDIERAEILFYGLIYRFFQLSSFSGKMNTLNELIRLLSVCDNNSLGIGQWIKDNKLLKLLLGENLHQPQYVEKVEEVIRFMIRKSLLTSSDLDTIWESQIDKHETIVKNVFNMLTHLALEFSVDQLNYLFNRFKKSWNKATKRQRECLINLISTLAEQDKDGIMMQKILDLLWEWSTSIITTSYAATDGGGGGYVSGNVQLSSSNNDDDDDDIINNIALKAHTKILSCSDKSFVYQLRIGWLDKLANILKSGPNEACLLPAAKQFTEIANLFNMGTANIVVRNLCQQHRILQATVDCIIQIMWSLHEERFVSITSSNRSMGNAIPIHASSPKRKKVNGHLIKVKELLKLIRYLIFQCNSLFTIDMLQQIWDSMFQPVFRPDFVLQNNSLLSKFRNHIVLPVDRDICFQWFTLFFTDPVWFECRDFIWDNYTALKPELMTSAGLEFVVQLFCRINSDNTCTIREFNIPLATSSSPSSISTVLSTLSLPLSASHVDTPATSAVKLINLEQLWNFILFSNRCVYRESSRLLLQLYTKAYSRCTKSRQELCSDIMRTCYAHIKTAYDEICSIIKKEINLDESKFKKISVPHSNTIPYSSRHVNSLFKRILRIIKLLKKFTITLNIESYIISERETCIPLKRSWIGSSFHLTVTCQGLPNTFYLCHNKNNRKGKNQKHTFLSNGTTVTVALIVHGNVTVGELRAFLLDFCVNGYPSNSPSSSSSLSPITTTIPLNCNDDNKSHYRTKNRNDSSVLHPNASQYELELSVLNTEEEGEQTNGNNWLLNCNMDNELLIDLLSSFPKWTRQFLKHHLKMEDEEDHRGKKRSNVKSDDASLIHLQLSAKLMYSNNNNIDGLSTSITDSPVTSPSFLSSDHFEFHHPGDFVTPKSSALNSNNNIGNDAKLNILQVYRDLLSNHHRHHLHPHDNNNNSSVDINVDNACNTLSELTIFNSIIDFDLHKEEEVIGKGDDQQQSVVDKIEIYCDDSLLSLSKDELDKIDDSKLPKSIQQVENQIQDEITLDADRRIEFLLNLGKLALTLNCMNVCNNIMALLKCMPLHKKLVKFIEDSLNQSVGEKLKDSCGASDSSDNASSSEPLLSNTWFGKILTNPLNESIEVFTSAANEYPIMICQNTPNYIEILYTLQVLYCVLMPSSAVKHYHFSSHLHTVNTTNTTTATTIDTVPTPTKLMHADNNLGFSTDLNSSDGINCNNITDYTGTTFLRDDFHNQFPNWSNAVNVTLLLLRGGALSLLLSSPLLTSVCDCSSSNCTNDEEFSRHIICDTLETIDKSSFHQDHINRSSFVNAHTFFSASVNSIDESIFVCERNTRKHWRLIYQIRMWLFRLLRLLLISIANSLILHYSLSSSSNNCKILSLFQKTPLYHLLSSSLLPLSSSSGVTIDTDDSHYHQNKLSCTYSLPVQYLSPDASTTSTHDDDNVKQERDIEYICKLLQNTHQLSSNTSHPVFNGSYFILLHAIYVARLTIKSDISLSEIETSWLKNISSGLKILCFNAWQAKFGCENMNHYYHYPPINKEKIFNQVNSVASQFNPSTMVTTETVVDTIHLDDESSLTKQIDRTECCEIPSLDKEIPSLEVKTESFIDAANEQQELSPSPSLTSTSSSSSSSVSSIRCLHSITSPSASSSTSSSSSNSSSRSYSSLGSENHSSSTSSSRRRSNNSTTSENGGIQSKLLYHNFQKEYFNSLQSGEIVGSVTMEALNCIPWYECLYSHDKLCNLLKYPLPCKKLVNPSQGNLSIGQHHQEQKQRDNDPSHRSHHHQHSHYRRHHHCDDQYHLFASSSTSQFVHASDQLTIGVNILQDLLFSESLFIRLSTKDFIHISLTSCLASKKNENDIYFMLEEMFHWLPEYVPSKIHLSDQYFHLFVLLIPLMSNHKEFLQSARNWLTEEMIWLRAAIYDRQTGDYSSFGEQTTPPDPGVPTVNADCTALTSTITTLLPESYSPMLSRKPTCFKSCNSDSLKYFHCMPVKHKDILLCGHLQLCIALFKCLFNSSNSTFQSQQMRHEGEIKTNVDNISSTVKTRVHSSDSDVEIIDVNDSSTNCVVDTNHKSAEDTVVNHQNSDLSAATTTTARVLNQTCLVKDMLELLIFPASRWFAQLHEGEQWSELSNKDQGINNTHDHVDGTTEAASFHPKSLPSILCSRKLLNYSFSFLLSMAYCDPSISQLLASRLYDIMFCVTGKPVNSNLDCNLAPNTPNSVSALSSSSSPSTLLSVFKDENDFYTWIINNANCNTDTLRFVGLKNGGATCYMNSIIQQLFTLEPIRDCVLSANPECLLRECNKPMDDTLLSTIISSKSTNSDGGDSVQRSSLNNETTIHTDDLCKRQAKLKPLSREKIHHLNVLYHMQTIFGHLAYSRVKYYAPVEFWRNFKFRSETVQVGEQHDAVEFFHILGNNLDEALELCQLPKIVEVILGGKFADQKICLDCPHRYTSYESFTTLNVDILDHRNLVDSLEQYVKGELLEGDNAYHCCVCDKKIPILKRMCIQKLPLVLAIQLKRFDYDWEQGVSLKFNNYCEFPRQLDMLPYTVQGLKDSMNASNDDETNISSSEVVSGAASGLSTTDTCNNANHNTEVIQPQEKRNASEEDGDNNENPCTKYNLRGVVVHSGQASSGHYYSYIRHYVPKTRTYKWYRYEDHNVFPVPLDKHEEAVSQWFGGELKQTLNDVPKFSRLRCDKRWWSAYLLFYEREDFNEQIKKLPIPRIGSDSHQSKLLTERVKDIIISQNIEHLHYRMQFHPLLPEFIYHFVNNNIQLFMKDTATQGNLTPITFRLLLHFIDLHYQIVLPNWKRWLFILLKLVAVSTPSTRCELIKSTFLKSPDQIKFLLFDCPYPEIRFMVASLIVYICHLCMNDPSVQYSDILKAFISLADSHPTMNTDSAIHYPDIVRLDKTRSTLNTSTTGLSHIPRPTINGKSISSSSVGENSTIDCVARIFSATCFINRFLAASTSPAPTPHLLHQSSTLNDNNNNNGNGDNDNSESSGSQMLMINPGHCLIQLVIHQLYFSPNALLPLNKSFQQYYHSYCTTHSVNNSNSSSSLVPSFPSSATVTSESSMIITTTSPLRSFSEQHHQKIDPNSSAFGPCNHRYPSIWATATSTPVPSTSSSSPSSSLSSVVWAQYFAILLDYASYGIQECHYLLKLRLPEILVNYVLTHEVSLTNLGTTSMYNVPTSAAFSIWNQEPSAAAAPLSFNNIQASIKSVFNELLNEMQSCGCPKLCLSYSVDALIYGIFSSSLPSFPSIVNVSNSHVSSFNQSKYDHNESLNSYHVHNSNNNGNRSTCSTVMYSGLRILFDLISYLIRSCEIPSQYLNITTTTGGSVVSKTPISSHLSTSSSSLYISETAPCVYSSSVSPSSMKEDNQTSHHTGNQHNPYCTMSTPVAVLSNTMIQLFLSNHKESVVKQLTGSLLNSITLQPISDILLFFSYGNFNFSRVALRELVYCLLQSSDLGSVIKLIECLLSIPDSLKAIRIRLFFSYSKNSKLFHVLNSKFIREKRTTTAYQVFYLYLNLLFTHPDVITYLSNEVYLLRVLSELNATALHSLRIGASHNWPDDDKQKKIEACEQAEQILLNLIPSAETNLKCSLVDLVTYKPGGHIDCESEEKEFDEEEDDDDDDDQREDEEDGADADDEGGNDSFLTKSLHPLASSSLSFLDDDVHDIHFDEYIINDDNTNNNYRNLNNAHVTTATSSTNSTVSSGTSTLIGTTHLDAEQCVNRNDCNNSMGIDVCITADPLFTTITTTTNSVTTTSHSSSSGSDDSISGSGSITGNYYNTNQISEQQQRQQQISSSSSSYVEFIQEEDNTAHSN